MAAVTDDKAMAIAESRRSLWFWRFVRRLLRMTLHPFLHLEARGVEHLNRPGPLLIAPVHRSNIDAPLLGALGDRRIRCLAKRSLFTNGVFGWIISALGAFPVDRGTADRDSLASAQRVLENGHALLVFPEGTRQVGYQVTELFEGVVFLAARTGAPIVPVGIAGTGEALASGSKLPKRTTVRVVAGEPMELETNGGRMKRSARREATLELRRRLQAVLDEAAAAAK
jgi:1-acyl-sn-glycerol-3-phosphate acyltransferase